jgi:hypothetical protein
LAKAKEKASRTVCMNNQKQILLAHHFYLNDSNDKIAPPNCGGAAASKSPGFPAGWLYKPGETLPGVPGPGQTNGPSKGVFFSALRSWSMYMCPLHRTNTYAWIASNIKFTSYVMNGVVINGGPGGSFNWGNGTAGVTYRASAFKITDMIFWEPDETDSNQFNDASSSPGEGLTRRHNLGAVIGLMGGHVEFVKWAKYYQLLADQNKNSLWCYPDSPNGR